MDILKLLLCKGNKSSVVRQQVVIDFKEPDDVGLSNDCLDDLAG